MIDTLTDEQLARARARTHERVNDLIVAPRRRRRSPAAALVTATALAAAAVVLAPGGSPTRPAVATAATVLRGLQPQPLPRLGPGEFYAVRVVQRRAANPAKALDLRFWSDARGEGREVALLDGKVRRDVPLGTPLEGVPPSAASRLPTFPADPQDVPAFLRRVAQFRAPGEPAREPTTRDYVLAASQMVSDARGTPPETLRAVFAFLSGLPGMKLVGDVVDPLGRPGKAVAADGDPDRHEGIGVELIVDPGTGRPLAFIHYRDGDVDKPWLEMTRTEGVVTDTGRLP
jgi:hypothetical protein